jgi:hypothetical protein
MTSSVVYTVAYNLRCIWDVGFYVLAAVTMNNSISWGVATCTLEEFTKIS